MEAYYFITISVLMALFIFFLIISKTSAASIGLLTRIEFLLSTELKFKSEEIEVQKVLSMDMDFDL